MEAGIQEAMESLRLSSYLRISGFGHIVFFLNYLASPCYQTSPVCYGMSTYSLVVDHYLPHMIWTKDAGVLL